MEKETCKICNDGKEYKNLSSHLRQKHDMSYEEYNIYVREQGNMKKFMEAAEEDMKEESINDEVVDIDEEIEEEVEEDEKVVDTDDVSNEDLLKLLNKFNISPEKMVELIIASATGKDKNISDSERVDREIQSRLEAGQTEADALAGQEKVVTEHLHTAEMLQKRYGYVTTKVDSAGNTKPKTWHLVKKNK